MENKEFRWKQRLSNFSKALTFLNKAIEKEHLSELERAGAIQSFEFVFELAWKTMKDYLNEQGVNAMYPREVIKQSFQ